jgi:hypothetical protein
MAGIDARNDRLASKFAAFCGLLKVGGWRFLEPADLERPGGR